MGSQWGGTKAGQPTGLNRAPTFSGYGWNLTVAGKLSKLTLVIQGLEDGILSTTPTGTGTGKAIYQNLTAAPNKVLVEVECASHALPWESAGSWAGPHYMLKKALIEWIKSGRYNGNESGSVLVKESGQVIQQ